MRSPYVLRENCFVSFNVSATPIFEKQAKRLARKYRSLPQDLAELISELENNPEIGSPLGHNCFKIRLAIKSKGKGKSGGARVVTFVRIVHQSVRLITIFDKSEKETIGDEELLELLSNLD